MDGQCLIGQSIKTVRRRIADGTIPAYRLGPRQIWIKVGRPQGCAAADFVGSVVMAGPAGVSPK